MPATLSSVAPASAAPGSQITILGTGIAAGAIVWFATDSLQAADPASIVVDPTQIQATVPDNFGGLQTPLQVYVLNPGDTPSGYLPFTALANAPESGIYPLCNLGDLKALLGISTDDVGVDRTFTVLIAMASGQVAGYCRRDFRPVTIANELHDGDGTRLLRLLHEPIQSVTALTIESQVVPVQEVKVYPDFIKFEEINYGWNPRLQANNRIFPCGSQNISVSYVAGYTVIPGDLANACILQAIFLQNTGTKQGVITETNQLTNSANTLSQQELCPAARVKANRYRRTSVSVV